MGSGRSPRVGRPPRSAPMIDDRISTVGRLPLARGKRTDLSYTVKTKPTPSPTLFTTLSSENRLAGSCIEAITDSLVDDTMKVPVWHRI